MSDEPQQLNQSTRSAFKKGVDWVAKHWPRVRLAHEGMMVEKIQRQQRCVEVVARNAMTGKSNDDTGWPGNGEDDSMGVAIGDDNSVTHHHNYPPTTVKAGLLKKATLAVLLASGVGLTGYLLGKLPQPDAPTTPSVDTDTTRRIDIEVRHAEERGLVKPEVSQ